MPDQFPGGLRRPNDENFHYPHGLLDNAWAWLKWKLTGRDPSAVPAPAKIVADIAPVSAGTPALTRGDVEIECTEQRKRDEFSRLSDEYVRVVERCLAAGWVHGPWGNIKISTGYADLGSCADWQNEIKNALCALPDIHCYQICCIRSVWHKAVVVYPKDAFWWRTAGTVFDPWFLGGPYAYTVGQWFMWSGLNWSYDCCK